MILFGGSVATVQAADNAKPGDLLFPLDQALEKIQLSWSAKESKETLMVNMAAERAREINRIIVQAQAKKHSDNPVARDKNIKTALNLVAEIKDRLGSARSTTTEQTINNIVKKIENELNTFEGPLKWQAKFKGDRGAKFEIEAEEEDDGQIKVNFQSRGFKFFTDSATSTATATATSTVGFGQRKIKICHHTGQSEWHDLKIAESAWAAHLAHGDQLGECPEPGEDWRGLSVAKAKIGAVSTVLTYKFNNQKTRLILQSTSIADIVQAIVARTGLKEAAVWAVLKIERDVADDDDDDKRLSTSTPVSIDPLRFNDEFKSGSSGDNDDDKDRDDNDRARGRGAKDD